MGKQIIKHIRRQREEDLQQLRETLLSKMSPDKNAQFQSQFEKLSSLQRNNSKQDGNDFDLTI